MDNPQLFRSKRKISDNRHNQLPNEENHNDRRHARRRLHQEIDRLENMSRSTTGLPTNPNHKVPYQKHPYESKHQKRILKTNHNNLFQPLRIRYFTEAMHEHKSKSNEAVIEFVESVILQKAADFWSSALSVVPVSGGRLRMNTYDLYNGMYCGDPEFSLVPPSHITEGVEDADLIWYVSATPSDRLCGPSTLAVAIACNFDQFDRPTAGAINFCLDQIQMDGKDGVSEAVKQDNVDVAVHEAAHILGMSSNAFRYFYDSETGKPRTSRPFRTQTVTCVDGVRRTEVLPALNTLKMGVDHHGQIYAAIVTPRVKQVVRNHFNCQKLEGAQLENQPTESGSCIGDHWEEKFFYPEALTSVMSPTTNVLSPLTLALMEDSGWYIANFSKASLLPWGHGAGCDFVEQPCLDYNEGQTTIPKHAQGFFCNDEMKRGCSSGQTHKMACNLLDYSRDRLSSKPPPRRYQYFESESKGGLQQVDYCPVFGSSYGGLSPEQLECENDDNVNNINIFSEYYGKGSKCIETNTGSARCYLTQCVRDPPSVKVNIRGVWYKCKHDFEQVSYKTNKAGILNGVFTCPRLSSVCPDLFCPVNCAGRGICDYDHKVNGTIRPSCKCFNTSDTSPACTESYVPKGDFFLKGPLYQYTPGFLDPLISVFLDSPQTWSKTTWGLAAGGIFLFFKIVICILYSFCIVRNPSKEIDDDKDE